MNETIKTLTTRKSCKSYKPQHITREQLDTVISAGLNAPSGRNMQTPLLVAVTDDDTVRYLSKLNAEIIHVVNVVPTLAPKITAIDCCNVINPALTKLTTIVVDALEL